MKTLTRIVLAAGLLAVAGLGQARAAEIFVSPSGSDQNPGSVDKPLQTFAGANGQPAPPRLPGMARSPSTFWRGLTISASR